MLAKGRMGVNRGRRRSWRPVHDAPAAAHPPPGSGRPLRLRRIRSHLSSLRVPGPRWPTCASTKASRLSGKLTFILLILRSCPSQRTRSAQQAAAVQRRRSGLDQVVRHGPAGASPRAMTVTSASWPVWSMTCFKRRRAPEKRIASQSRRLESVRRWGGGCEPPRASRRSAAARSPGHPPGWDAEWKGWRSRSSPEAAPSDAGEAAGHAAARRAQPRSGPQKKPGRHRHEGLAFRMGGGGPLSGAKRTR